MQLGLLEDHMQYHVNSLAKAEQQGDCLAQIFWWISNCKIHDFWTAISWSQRKPRPQFILHNKLIRLNNVWDTWDLRGERGTDFLNTVKYCRTGLVPSLMLSRSRCLKFARCFKLVATMYTLSCDEWMPLSFRDERLVTCCQPHFSGALERCNGTLWSSKRFILPDIWTAPCGENPLKYVNAVNCWASNSCSKLVPSGMAHAFQEMKPNTTMMMLIWKGIWASVRPHISLKEKLSPSQHTNNAQTSKDNFDLISRGINAANSPYHQI